MSAQKGQGYIDYTENKQVKASQKGFDRSFSKAEELGNAEGMPQTPDCQVEEAIWREKAEDSATNGLSHLQW